MNLRGPLLITASFSTLLAVWVWRQQQIDQSAPVLLDTVYTSAQICEERGLDTAMGRLGCDPEANATGPTRSTRAGGAL
ncbi:MAG TPA: hypothetical protein ENK83_08165, partial [Aliiroseovarius sp.]|nr:hypothetical protein [Aliiroseovarius sp.]